MEDFMDAYDENDVDKRCATCEFYMGGVCAGGDGVKHNYGDSTEPDDACDDWGPSLRYFEELEQQNDEYVNNYDQDKVDRKCGNCKFRVGNSCYGENMPVGMPVSRKNQGCENWRASSEYVIKLRKMDQTT